MPRDKNIKYVSIKRAKPLIFVTNDDGYMSDGIKALTRALREIADVIVVAPATEQSVTSHSFSLYRPLRCKKKSKNLYVVDGTPTDCVILGVNFILKGVLPDILFSGINRGPNLGDDINYSGTVSAAVEGGILGIPSVAISCAAFKKKGMKYKSAAKFALRIAKKILKEKLPKDIIFNVNVPNLTEDRIKGYRFTSQGKINYANVTTEKLDPRGQKYYWTQGEQAGFEDIKGSDCNAISDGFVSITPVKVTLTDNAFLKKIKNWRI